MLRRHEKIWSPAMQRDIRVLAYGHWGAPVIAFPSGLGNYFDFENFGMIESLAHLIDGGRIKLYCPESNDWETWLGDGIDLGTRCWRHRAYEDFIVNNLVPAIRFDCHSPGIRMGLTGCSWGAYHAANFALKHPHLFHYALCMSGKYDLGSQLDGEYNAECYFNDPVAYVPNLGGEALDHVRTNTHLSIVCGQGEFEHNCLWHTHRLANVVQGKGISCWRDIWGPDSAHKWYWWRKQIAYHFGKTFGW